MAATKEEAAGFSGDKLEEYLKAKCVAVQMQGCSKWRPLLSDLQSTARHTSYVRCCLRRDLILKLWGDNCRAPLTLDACNGGNVASLRGTARCLPAVPEARGMPFAQHAHLSRHLRIHMCWSVRCAAAALDPSLHGGLAAAFAFLQEHGLINLGADKPEGAPNLVAHRSVGLAR